MNKRIILSLLCVSLFGIGQMFSQFSVPGSNTMLGGAMVYNDDWVAVDDNGNYINPITAGIRVRSKPVGLIISRLPANAPATAIP